MDAAMDWMMNRLETWEVACETCGRFLTPATSEEAHAFIDAHPHHLLTVQPLGGWPQEN